MVLTEWARHRGYEVVKVYEEEESAWKAGHQRELAVLLRDARKGRFSIALVWALDRLSREGALAILTFLWSLRPRISGRSRNRQSFEVSATPRAAQGSHDADAFSYRLKLRLAFPCCNV